MKFSHCIVLHGVSVLVQLDINVDALANDLGAKAADNASGRSSVRFGNVKAAITGKDLQALTAAKAAHHAKFRATGTRPLKFQFRCDQCEMVSINGHACHEVSCPNMGARFDTDTGEWIKQIECGECGQANDAGTTCCDPIDNDPELPRDAQAHRNIYG